MRLSEAGLLGGMETEQCTGNLFIAGKTCFLGGALVAIGKLKDISGLPYMTGQEQLYTILKQEFPILNERFYNESVLQGIFRRNDNWMWTRPQIANWLKSIEDSFEAKQVKQVEQLKTNIEVDSILT